MAEILVCQEGAEIQVCFSAESLMKRLFLGSSFVSLAL